MALANENKYYLLRIFSTEHISCFSTVACVCFAFVSTKAVLVRKSRRTFGTNKPKAPLFNPFPKRLLLRKTHFGSPWARELTPKAAEGLFYDEIFAFTIPPSRYASHLPLHKGGSLPPDSSPERCNTLYLAGKAFEKEYEQSSVLLLLFFGR